MTAAISDSELASARSGYLDFLGTRKTIVIGTVDDDGVPFLSLTPFVRAGDSLYVYVSAIAEHYDHLLRSSRVMVLLHADEAGSKNLFAVERTRFTCTAREVPAEGNEAIFDQLRADHNPALIDLLRTLDFHLFELTPVDGRYIVGFGKAFDLDLQAERFDHVVIDRSKETAEAGK